MQILFATETFLLLQCHSPKLQSHLKLRQFFLGWFFTNQHIVVFVCQPCPFQSLEDNQ